MGAAHVVLGPHGVFDPVHFLLVALAVHHGPLLGVSQCSLQGLNSLSSRPQTLLQLWKLAAQICIVTNQLRDRGLWRMEGKYGIFICLAFAFNLNVTSFYVLTSNE